MKNLLFLISILVCLGFTQSAYACFPPDTAVWIEVSYDSTMFGSCEEAREIEIRLTNFRVMNEMPNKICACGLENLAVNYSQINYLAFVDSGTNNPYNGIVNFDATTASSNAWNSATGGSDWSGFVADVVNNGLDVNSPVEFVIRAEALPGTVIEIDTSCTAGSNGGTTTLSDVIENTSFGTDAWDPILEDLDQSHQGIRDFGSSSATINYTRQTPAYFTTLDDDILNNLPVDTNTANADFFYTAQGKEVDFYDDSNPNALQYLIWDFGDGSQPIKAYGMVNHVYADYDEYEVCLYNINNGDTAAQACKTIDLIDTTIGIASIVAPTKVHAFPNPANDILTVKFIGDQSAISQVQLVTLIGQKVEVDYNPNSSMMNVTNVNAGMYFIRATYEGESIHSDMIIINH